MIILKKTKLKVKKQVWIVLVIIIFGSIGLYTFHKVSEERKYQKTNEYKLLKIGYTKEDIKSLEEKTNSEIIKQLLSSPKNEFILALIKDQYYLNKNLDRYLNYNKENSSVSPNDVVALINVNRDYAYYDHDIEANLSLKEKMLVNKYYKLPEDYTPEDLVNVSNKYYYGENHKIAKSTYEAFVDMWNEAYKEDVYLIINSSFRTYESQVSVYDYYKNSSGTTYADSIAARPGYSEHQTGLSLDIFSKNHITADIFKGSPAHIWLQNNAHRFGFIERYPEGKENITGFKEEAWHYRYVGSEIATYIHDNNITFDEYYAYFMEK